MPKKVSFVAAVLILLSVCPCFAGNQDSVVHLSNGVTVSASFMGDRTPIKFDHDPAGMTDAEFAEFAKWINESARMAAQERYARYLVARGDLKYEDLYSSTKSTATQFGGGHGMGGLGGAGGYLGYGTGGIGSGYGVTLNPGGNYGQGFQGNNGASFEGNRMSELEHFTSRKYRHTFPDLNDNGGGPVTIINPYCAQYWRERAAK